MNATATNLQHKTDSKLIKTNASIIKFPQKKNKGGRPSKYTDELASEICIAIMNSDKGIVRLRKEYPHWPNKATIFKWLNTNKEFQEQYKRAKQVQIHNLLDELLGLPEKIYTYIDKLGNLRVHPITIELMQLKIDDIKWKTVHLMTRKYENN